MSEHTILIASVERLFKNLEMRIERIEKLMNREFHGSSGYTKGCRCKICKTARTVSMRKYRRHLALKDNDR